MPGKRIVFCTYGSLGDVYPFLSLARELKSRGHSPVIATPPFYRHLVESEGIEFHPVRPDLDANDPELLRKVMAKNTGGRFIICDIIMPTLRDAYEDTADAAKGADLLVTHPLTFSAMLYARKTGIPWASVALAPVSMYSAYDPSIITGLPFAEKIATWGPFLQRQLLKFLRISFEPMAKPLRKFEKELGLPSVPNPLFFGHSEKLALALFSPILAAPQRDWPSNAHATGFPFFGHGEGNPPDLEQFLDSGEPPVVFTLGSSAVGVAGDFFQQSVEAVQSLGKRAVLLIGRDPRNQPKQALPQGVIAVQYAPHAALFPRASVIVHQGGVGTTGEAMRSGRPMLVVPYSHDQPDHAARLGKLGIARYIPREKYNAKIAAQEIQQLLGDKNYAQRAADIGRKVRCENGVAAACDLLSQLLDKSSVRERVIQRTETIVA